MGNRCGILTIWAITTIAGCARTDHFEVQVHNATTQPLTLSLAKKGGPYEDVWQTPEDFAIEAPQIRDQRPTAGTTKDPVPPGKTAFIHDLVGHFDADSQAFLRVYSGKPSISQMLSRPADSPDRVDVLLAPGRNDITIEQEAAHLKATVRK